MITIIQTPTPDISKSKDFYTKLGFSILSLESPILFADGKCIIEINPDHFSRAGVKLYNISWKKTVDKLDKITAVQKAENGYLLSDPSGTWIYLIELETVEDFNLASISSSVLGNNAGLSLESIDINLSVKIWKSIGFTNQQGALDQGWVTLTNSDGITVSFMKPNTCPHLFFNPSLTFFNGGNNLAIIEKIRELNIPISEEITYFNKEGIVDNIIICDPGGFGFFLFNDG
jgi:hypothetical protein